MATATHTSRLANANGTLSAPREISPYSQGDSPETPRSVRFASGGIRTAQDLATFGSYLLADLMTDRVGTKKAHAACRTGELMLNAAWQGPQILTGPVLEGEVG